MFFKFFLLFVAAMIVPVMGVCMWSTVNKSFLQLSKAALVGLGLTSVLSLFMVSYAYFIVWVVELIFS